MILRLLTLGYVIIIFSINLWFFSLMKHRICKITRHIGLRGLNIFIIALTFMIIVSSACQFLAITITLIKLIIDSNDFSDPENTIAWFVLRGILGPLLHITELTLICYMVYYQDSRNMSHQKNIMKVIKKEFTKEQR